MSPTLKTDAGCNPFSKYIRQPTSALYCRPSTIWPSIRLHYLSVNVRMLKAYPPSTALKQNCKSKRIHECSQRLVGITQVRRLSPSMLDPSHSVDFPMISALIGSGAPFSNSGVRFFSNRTKRVGFSDLLKFTKVILLMGFHPTYYPIVCKEFGDIATCHGQM